MIPMALSLPRSRVGDRTAELTMDEAAFRHFYRCTARPLRAYLIRACGDLTLADDLLQDAYLRFLRSGFEGDDDDHRKNYLFKIATNALRDHFRRKRPETDTIPEKGGSPGHDDAVHLRSDVGGAMSELSVKDRQMLWLAYVEGSSHEEIAAALGLRTASIRSMLFRARHRLAEKLRTRGLHPEGVGS